MMKKGISKKILILCAVTAVACVLPLTASAADKLLVKDATNAVKFVSTDTGEIGVNTATPQYSVDILNNGAVSKSQLHFSKDGNAGGWITSVAENNFYMSSGAVYDFDAGGWIQQSTDGKSIFFGSGAIGFGAWANSGNTVDQVLTSFNKVMAITYDGYVGFGVAPTQPLQLANGAHCTVGGVWTNASSRDYKENIQEVTTSDAFEALAALTPVTYNYKVEPSEEYVGFIAEDVPAIVATNDRKSISPMDVTALLTKVVQEQQKMIAELASQITDMKLALVVKQNEVGSLAQAQLPINE